MRIAWTLNSYIDRVSEEVVSAYELEKEKWLRNQSAARAARVRALLRNEQPDVASSEAILGYRLRQHHLGLVTWITGPPAGGVAGFRRTHQQALSAQAVALSAGSAASPVTTFAEVAPLALMSGSLELLRAWVAETLGPLAEDDDQNARLRDTLRVFLQENGSYKATAERLVLHKNTVQYRPSAAPGRPAGYGQEL